MARLSAAIVAFLVPVAVSAQEPDTPGALPVGRAQVRIDAGGVELELFTYKPAGYRGERMILVLHGVLRNADEYRDHAVGMAERFAALVVAPRFDSERFPSRAYQQGGLRRADGSAAPPGEWTYARIPRIVERVREREGRADLPFWIIGHSAGGQFVARMSAFQDTGAQRHVAANPGSHLFPTRDLPFGYGFGELPAELAGDDALARYLAAPLTLYLGTDDDGPDDYFDSGRNAMSQGSGRHQRGLACYWTARTLAAERRWRFGWRLVEADGVGHDHEKMFDHAACELALFGSVDAKPGEVGAGDARSGDAGSGAAGAGGVRGGDARSADSRGGEPPPWTAAQMREDLGVLAERVASEWSYHDDRRDHDGVDVPALLARAERELDAVASRAGFARVLERFVAALHDGHARVTCSAGVAATRHLPVRLVDTRDGVVVAAIANGLVASPAVGDVVLALDGVPIDVALAESEATAFGSTPGMRRRLALSALERSAAPRVRLRVRSGDVERELELATLDAEPRELGDPTQLGVSWPAPRVALLRVPSLAVVRWRDWLAAAPEQRDELLAEDRARIERAFADVAAGDARALILDLRGNGGGTDLLGICIAEHLLARPFRYFLLSAKRDGAWTTPHGYEYGTAPREHRFTGPLLALVDAGSFSATDNLLRCLDDLHPDLTVVGRSSGGGTGAPRVIATLPHSGAVVVLCTQRVYGPGGELTEGRGTRPDIEVAWTREDVAEGRDPDLAAALAHVAR